jgi:tetratricopeptide (TPR) repeat protein
VLQLPGPVPDYASALERSARNLLQRQIALDRERSEACTLVPKLLRHRPERQRLILGNDRHFHTWGVLESLLEHGRDHLLADSLESERLASLALAQTDHLDAGYYGPTRIEDMRARAWATLGEARRLRSDFAGSGQAFDRARSHLASGTGDSLEQAILFESEAGLRRCQRRFGEARSLLLQAIGIFIENGEEQRSGLALVSLAAVDRDEGEPARALPRLQEALRRNDRDGNESEPRLLLCAQHVLADCLAAAGRFMEARGVLILARPLYRRFPDGWTQGHLRWLRGRIAFGLGQMAEAEAELLGARSTLLARGAVFEAALVCRELAALYARQERAAELAGAAAEAIRIFDECGVGCEARKTEVFFRQVEEIEGAWQELARAAGTFGE